MAETWPDDLRPTNVGFWLEHSSRSGGVALNGTEQTVASGAARWRARLDLPIRTKAQVLAARVFLTRLEGRANEALVPVFDGKRAPWPVDAYGRTLHPGFTRDKRLDGTQFEDPEIPATSSVIATVNADAALRAIELGILKTQGSAFEAGQYFGVANRLYLITEIISVVGSITRVGFRPPLRAAVLAGALVTFTRPVCTMKLVSDDQVRMDLALLRFADLSLEFTESFS